MLVYYIDKFVELVCSNLFCVNILINVVGVIKEEMCLMDFVIICVVDECFVLVGGVLVVDCYEFVVKVIEYVKNYLNVIVMNEEIIDILEGLIIIVIGLLIFFDFFVKLKELIGEDYFYFYDVVVLIVEKDSIDMNKVYLKLCYDKGEVVYLNCLMIEEEFDCFYEVLIVVEIVFLKEFEKEIFFEGCMLVEVMVSRGR